MALSKRRLSVIVLGVLLVSLALRFTPLTIGVPIFLNTDTQVFNIEGWEARGSTSFGGELLDGAQYITSWMPNGDSEKMVAEVEMKFNLFASYRDDCRYFWYLNTGLGWQALDPPASAVPCGTAIVGEWDVLNVVERLLRIPLVGGIAVEFQMRTGYDFILKHDYSWKTFARDEAHLRPGVGDVAFDKPTYAVLDTAIIRYDVGYASSVKEGGGWTIQLHEPPDRGGAVVDSWTVSDNTRGQVTHTWAITDFVRGESNVFTVKLLNAITGVKDDDTAVVDDIDLAPRILGVSVQPPGTRSVGDAMTVTVAAVANDVTGLPITEYYFHIRAGPSTVITDAWQTGPVFAFTIQSDGDIQINVCVRDAERSSCAPRINLLVEDPDTPFWVPGDPYTPPWWMWLAVGFLLAGAFGVQFLRPIPPGGRNLVSLFLVAGVAVILLAYLVIPVVEAWVRGFIPGVF